MRSAIGIAALLLLALALNVLVWQRSLFALGVLIPLGLALVGGVAWAALTLKGTGRWTGFEGRAVGGLNAFLSSAIFLGICIVLYAFTAAWDVSWDLTREGRRELSEQTRKVLRNMNEEVTVTCFFLDVDDKLIRIAKEKTVRFLERCQEYTDLLKVEVEDPQLAVARMEKMGINFASTQGTVVVHAGARQRVITLSGGSPRLEERDFTNALVNVLRNTKPKVYYLMGHGEPDIKDRETGDGAGGLAEVLLRESYELDTLELKPSEAEVPRDCDILIINNPKGDLFPQEIEALDAYLSEGGRLMVLLDPWIQQPQARREHLRPWLTERAGAEVGSNVLLTNEQKNRFDLELSMNAEPFGEKPGQGGQFRGCFHASHPIVRGFDQQMLLQASRSVAVAEDVGEGLVATPLLRTTPDFWAESDVATLSETGEAEQNEGEPSGPLTVAVATAARADEGAEDNIRYDEARTIVAGDSDFVSNSFLTFPGNLNFIMNAFAWLSESEELIAIRPSGKTDRPVVLSPAQKSAIAWVSTLFTVQVVVLAGLVVYFLRRKAQ